MTAQAVGSVLGQDIHRRIEIIVVDDASSDNTREELKALFPDIKIISTGRPIGTGPARNLGAEAASGRILMFLDSDDLWHSHHATILLDALQKAPAAFCLTRNIRMDTGEFFQVPDRYLSGQIKAGDPLEILFKWCYIMPSSFAILKDEFRVAGGFPDQGLGEDWLFFLDVSAGSEIKMVESVATTRRLHEGSLCTQRCNRRSIETLLGKVKGKAASLPEDYESKGRIMGWISRHEALIRQEADSWQTVQDWYSALKEKGLQ